MNRLERRLSMAENSHPKEMEMREALGRTLVEFGREDPRVVVLDADLNTSSKTVLFKKTFPDRFFQIGIAEQNLFGSRTTTRGSSRPKSTSVRPKASRISIS